MFYAVGSALPFSKLQHVKELVLYSTLLVMSSFAILLCSLHLAVGLLSIPLRLSA